MGQNINMMEALMGQLTGEDKQGRPRGEGHREVSSSLGGASSSLEGMVRAAEVPGWEGQCLEPAWAGELLEISSGMRG